VFVKGVLGCCQLRPAGIRSVGQSGKYRIMGVSDDDNAGTTVTARSATCATTTAARICRSISPGSSRTATTTTARSARSACSECDRYSSSAAASI